ncbi:aromatic amino acid exporter YddG [Marinobacterium jannaschii]|uniref:aromatic amino acid exporter YddG n=1 Tax=Marinobacterium jannaschii TaxID=64970 RepID=UPI00056CAF8B|nr:DMT family transporter [Marinobacterium jannaschii]
MQLRSLANLAGMVSIFLWGALALFTRETEGMIPPFQLLAMTFSLAFLLMALRWWWRGETGLRYLRQPRLAWVLGVGGYFGYHFCYFLAMQKAPAVEVSLLAYLWPLLIVLFSALLPGERLAAGHVIGALISLAGCWLLLGDGEAGFDSQYLPGYLLAGSCALIWSGYSVSGRFVRQVPTDAVGWFCAVTALLGLGCHLLLEETYWPLTTGQWLAVLGLGLGPVGIAFFTWDYAVKRGDLQLLGVLSYAAPLISTLLLLLVGQAESSLSLWLACGAIVSGAFIASRARRQSPSDSVKEAA